MQIVTRNLIKNLVKSIVANNSSNKPTTGVQSYNHLANNRWLDYDQTHLKSVQTHKSQAEEFIHRVPVLEVENNIVRCIGGTELNAGHPQVYIQLNTRTPGQVLTCKYCGLRYKKKEHDHHHH